MVARKRQRVGTEWAIVGKERGKCSKNMHRIDRDKSRKAERKRPEGGTERKGDGEKVNVGETR